MQLQIVVEYHRMKIFFTSHHMYPLYLGAPISAQPYPPSGGEGGAPPPPPPSGGATEQQGTAPPPNVVDVVSGYEGVTFQGGKRT